MTMLEKQLIDLNALGIGRCNPDIFENRAYADGWNAAIKVIETAPTVDAVEVIHSKWLEKKDGFACSNCRKRAGSQYGISGAYLSNYCPNCGAKMDGKE